MIQGMMKEQAQQRQMKDIAGIAGFLQGGGQFPSLQSPAGGQMGVDVLMKQWQQRADLAAKQHGPAFEGPGGVLFQTGPGDELKVVLPRQTVSTVAGGALADMDPNDPLFWERVGKGSGGTTISNVMGTGTQGKLETEILDLDKSIGRLKEVRQMYDPSFSTIPTQMQMGATAAIEKWGKGVEGIAGKIAPSLISKEAKSRLAQYKTWKSKMLAEFLAAKKAITGVSAGPKEIEQIQKAFPDPENASPTEFQAMLDSLIDYSERLQAKLTAYRKIGTVPEKNPELMSQILMETLVEDKQSTPTPNARPKSIAEYERSLK